MNTLTFDSYAHGDARNVSSYYGLRIATAPTDESGSPAGEQLEMAGTMRYLVQYSGAFQPATRTYQVSFPCANNTELRTTIRNVRQWLFINSGQHRLIDDYDPLVYRLAYAIQPVDFDTWLTEFGQANLAFSCDARKFLLTGETKITATNGGTIDNSYMPSNPTIELTVGGAGTLTFGGVSIHFNQAHSRTVIIDCENQTILDNTGVNVANKADIFLKFPVLPNGGSAISWNGSLSAVKVTPNWWQP